MSTRLEALQGGNIGGTPMSGDQAGAIPKSAQASGPKNRAAMSIIHKIVNVLLNLIYSPSKT
jgi:hypothetical protein